MWLTASLSSDIPPLTPPASLAERPAERVTKSTAAFRVLLAEDNAADVMLVREILKEQNAGFKIIVAHDGQEAIELVRDLDQDDALPGFDIALIDLNLPKRTGHEVLAAIRKTKRCAEIPVIIITSSGSITDINRARQLGATEYFEKLPDLDAYSALGTLVMQTLQRGHSAKS
jgi:two-component system, chemotaxis family, response regulator Rcp1